MTLEHVSEFPPPRPHEPAAHASLDLDDTPTVDSEDELFPCEEPFEDHVAESKRHFEARTALYLVVKNAFDNYTIASDQFFYPNRSNPGECLAPDLMVKTDLHVDDFDSWKTWRLGTPQLAVEIISASDRMKLTWKEKFARYEATDILEVVRFDRDKDEPITVWDRRGRHLIERRTNTEECKTLHLFWTIVDDPTFGKQLRLARDREGEDLLPTPDETNLLLAQQLANERYARSLAEREKMLAEQNLRDAETKLRDEADARTLAEQKQRDAEQKLRDAEQKLRDAEAAQAAALEEIERLRAAAGNKRMS